MRKAKAGDMVMTFWGVESPLVRVKCGLVVKADVLCFTCGENTFPVHLSGGCGGAYSYVVDPETGAYIANMRDDVYICPGCQEAKSARKASCKSPTKRPSRTKRPRARSSR